MNSGVSLICELVKGRIYQTRKVEIMPYASRERKLRYMKERYQLKKEELKDYQRSNRNLFNKIRLLKLKGIMCCESCGEDHPATLQFHHREPTKKVKSVMQLVGSNASWEVLQREVKKCDVLCANCHKLEHNNWTDEQIDLAWSLVNNGQVAIKPKVYKLGISKLNELKLLYYKEEKTLQEVADHFGVHKSTIHSFMIKHNLPRRGKQGHLAQQIAAEYFKDEEENSDSDA